MKNITRIINRNIDYSWQRLIPQINDCLKSCAYMKAVNTIFSDVDGKRLNNTFRDMRNNLPFSMVNKIENNLNIKNNENIQ